MSDDAGGVSKAPSRLEVITGGMALPAFLVVAGLFVACGSMSTVSVKWGNTMELAGRDGDVSHWEHPYCQTLVMFACEFLCMGAFHAVLFHKRHVRGQAIVPGVDTAKPVNRLVFFVPAMCDFTASTMMYVGLGFTTASAYQMLRGGTVLFTGIFSRVFLRRKFQLYQWLGIGFVVLGLAAVGLSTVLSNSGDATNPALGNAIILAAQLVASAQFVIEEKVYATYAPDPMQLVGWEGFFGGSVMLAALLVMLPIGGRPDDIWDWALQATSSWKPAVSLTLLVLSVPTFNATGNALTKYTSATTRMVLDTLRNVFVWGLSIAFFGESFKWLQLGGFIILVSGTAIYKHLVPLPGPFKHVEPDHSIVPADGVSSDDLFDEATELIEHDTVRGSTVPQYDPDCGDVRDSHASHYGSGGDVNHDHHNGTGGAAGVEVVVGSDEERLTRASNARSQSMAQVIYDAASPPPGRFEK